MSDIRKLFGERVRQYRKRQGISQEELGERANLHYTYIGAIERGEQNLSLESIEKIANGLGVSIEKLFRFKPIKPKPQSEMLRAEITNLLKNKDTKTLHLIIKILKDIYKLAKR
jgi:transcriptional regulator with XRE-family HTH domain